MFDFSNFNLDDFLSSTGLANIFDLFTVFISDLIADPKGWGVRTRF